MTMELALPNKVSKLLAMIDRAATPKETKTLEVLSSAERQIAREADNYHAFVMATKAYILARRKTTELILPEVRSYVQGRPSKLDQDVKLIADWGFTHKQWNRRVQELEVPLEVLDDYFDEVISNGWNPSLIGFMRHSRNQPAAQPSRKPAAFIVCPHCGKMIEG